MKRCPPTGMMILSALIIVLHFLATLGPAQDLPKTPPAQNANPSPGAATAPQTQAESAKYLVPAPFTTNGKKGWKVTIPGNRPLATPAVVSGKVFVGGGFGS